LFFSLKENFPFKCEISFAYLKEWALGSKLSLLHSWCCFDLETQDK